MKRIFNRIYYFVESLLMRGTPYQLAVVALGIVGLSALCGLIVFTFSPQFDDLPASVWWAFLRLTDPGYLGDDEGTLPRIVSTFLTLAGYVFFLGSLVARAWIRKEGGSWAERIA
ncbi:MAG: hypothetical protein ACLFVJ_20570 [Persicimonas sp.]